MVRIKVTNYVIELARASLFRFWGCCAEVRIDHDWTLPYFSLNDAQKLVNAQFFMLSS